ncbi:uncharacterized protein EI90DRAFT_3128816 [Cantharellus anzutake]|uniref:uncharacterized protein n=1 Tax=Cantharellus anzutake TaxID=1750568 RepID=UPI001905E041|nr:uncharacterized protein EI90DRAFT_3128816 [Cantharellus anzutake]KAF8325451.1 hypothetical protein EI90DRAFT_3128816 [Cantharellus anzutake]
MVVLGDALVIEPPLINSSCPWASNLEQLTELYRSPYTGAITTRTATMNGFDEDPNVQTVAFHRTSYSSINSYGYSPFPLQQYLSWLEEIIESHPSSNKPFIISITSSLPDELATMLDKILAFRRSVQYLRGNGKMIEIGVELNTSCPNIPNKPPPSYDMVTLLPLLEVLSSFHERQLQGDPPLPFYIPIGIKLSPYVHNGQFTELVSTLRILKSASGRNAHPISFLTCTNTLGSSLLFQDQIEGAPTRVATEFALPSPTGHGGLAGEAIHALSLGNVQAFSRELERASSDDVRLSGIKIIGVGGVTNREAVLRMKRAGASVVACATALGKEGVMVFEKLNGP